MSQSLKLDQSQIYQVSLYNLYYKIQPVISEFFEVPGPCPLVCLIPENQYFFIISPYIRSPRAYNVMVRNKLRATENRRARIPCVQGQRDL